MPEENEVYLAVPYLNKVGLETYTRLLLRKMVGLVLTSTTNIASYEEEYSANPDVSVQTTETEIEPGGIWTLPIAYGVGTGQLRVTVSGYIMYPGIDYEEVGEKGEASYQIEFKTHIASGSVIGAIVYPKQFSFGRNINVNSIVAPEAAISSSSDNLIQLDGDNRLIVSKSAIEAMNDALSDECVHKQGDEVIQGKKTFKQTPKVNLLDTDLSNTETLPLLEAIFKANGLQYSVKPISVLAGRATDEGYSGTVMVGSDTGCTWIGSGESFLNLPEAFNSAGIDFANDESVIVTSDSGMSVYVGCSNDGTSFVKAMQIEESGEASFPVALKAKTMPAADTSDNVATTEFVKNVSVNAYNDSTIYGTLTFNVSPMVPTAPFGTSDNAAASTKFVYENAVLLQGAQNIEGEKTFKENLVVSNASPGMQFESIRSRKGVLPSNIVESGFSVIDSNGSQMGAITHKYSPTGESSTSIVANDASQANSVAAASIGVAIATDGKPRTFAPTPPLNDASTQIATTAFVADALDSLRNEIMLMLKDIVTGEFEDDDNNQGGESDSGNTPVQPDMPTPDNPDEPDPDNPDEPDPDNPDEPDPDNPDEPDPDNPDSPSNPDEPDPDNPDSPSNPDEPESPESPESPDSPDDNQGGN